VDEGCANSAINSAWYCRQALATASESVRLTGLWAKGLALDSELLRHVWALVVLGLCLECSKV
jgi:hypothetical protein